MNIKRKALLTLVAVTVTLGCLPMEQSFAAKGRDPVTPPVTPPVTQPAPVTPPAIAPSTIFLKTLAPNFPASVPLPAGKISSSEYFSAGHWGVIVTLPLGYQAALASAGALYQSNGFVAPVGQVLPYAFSNGTYSITMVGANLDHNANRTNLTILVSQN